MCFGTSSEGPQLVRGQSCSAMCTNKGGHRDTLSRREARSISSLSCLSIVWW